MTDNGIYEFIRANDGLVAHVAWRFAPCPDLIPDIVQQVFLVFLQDAEKKNWTLDQQSTPLLYQVTKNVARQFWRKHQQAGSKSLQKIGEFLVRDLPPEESEPDDEILALRRCLEKLSPSNRHLVDLKYYLDTPTDEIAIMFDIKPNSVSRALARIRTVLAECISGSRLHHKEPDAQR